MECKKCKNLTSTLMLRKKDSYCETCFISSVNHKFRAVIGKHRILTQNQKVLLAVSGDLSSTVLLKLVHEGINLNTHKILKIFPSCVFVTGLGDGDNFTKSIIKQCNVFGFDVYIVHISQYEKSLSDSKPNTIPTVQEEDKEKLSIILKKMSITEQKDFISKIKRMLFIKVAQNMGYNNIFTSETTSTLARNLLSNIALGRGSQIEHDVGFCDSRTENVQILRPMKDITKEELDHFGQIMKLNPVHKSESLDNSLQCLIHKFATDLQENYPATISTVCKTAEKIGSNNETSNYETCLLCQSKTSDKFMNLSAADATEFSRAVCFGSKDFTKKIKTHNEGEMSSYCYACSRNSGII